MIKEIYLKFKKGFIAELIRYKLLFLLLLLLHISIGIIVFYWTATTYRSEGIPVIIFLLSDVVIILLLLVLCLLLFILQFIIKSPILHKTFTISVITFTFFLISFIACIFFLKILSEIYYYVKF
jgi:hypothetical protein